MASQFALLHTGQANSIHLHEIAASWPNSTCSANHSARLATTPTTAAVMARAPPISSRVLAQPLDVGRAEEDPEEARRERDPGGEQRPERSGEQWVERAGSPIGGNEAHELQHEDERPRRRLGQPQAIDHLARRKPAEGSTASCAT